MRVWKALILIVPAGLALGMVGGNLARPVMQQRAVEPRQSIFETRAERYGSAQSYPRQPQGSMAYVGGYSYPPAAKGWPQGKDDGGDWTYADMPLPTVAELDARQAELLADPDVEFAVSPPDATGQMADAAPALAGQQAAQVAHAPADLGREPRTADGKLPAIW
jgi:hypothetical protein